MAKEFCLIWKMGTSLRAGLGMDRPTASVAEFAKTVLLLQDILLKELPMGPALYYGQASSFTMEA
jgi:hypothetical protein